MNTAHTDREPIGKPLRRLYGANVNRYKLLNTTFHLGSHAKVKKQKEKYLNTYGETHGKIKEKGRVKSKKKFVKQY